MFSGTRLLTAGHTIQLWSSPVIPESAQPPPPPTSGQVNGQMVNFSLGKTTRRTTKRMIDGRSCGRWRRPPPWHILISPRTAACLPLWAAATVSSKSGIRIVISSFPRIIMARTGPTPTWSGIIPLSTCRIRGQWRASPGGRPVDICPSTLIVFRLIDWLIGLLGRNKWMNFTTTYLLVDVYIHFLQRIIKFNGIQRFAFKNNQWNKVTKNEIFLI